MGIVDAPLPGRVRFERPPVQLAIAQIQFTPVLQLGDQDFIAPLQERLRPHYPGFGRMEGLEVVVGAAGAESMKLPGGSGAWVFASLDGAWSVSIAADSATVETKNYTAFDELLERFLVIVDETCAIAKPAARVRLGLRYVNLLNIPEGQEGSVSAMVRSELRGPLAASDLVAAEKVRHFIGQFRAAEDEGQLLFRFGLLEPGQVPVPSGAPLSTSAFLLDLDFFDVRASQPLDIPSVRAQLSTFHEDIERALVWSLTDQGREALGLSFVA